MPTTLITDTSIVLPLQGFKGDKGDTGPVGATGPPAPSTISHDANNKATLGSDTYFLVPGVGSGLPATSHIQCVSGDDPQLTNSRVPLPHALSHRAGSGDALAIDVLAAPSDNTNLNASITSHGLLRKLDNNPNHVLNGVGAWVTPAGGGDMSKSDYDSNGDLVVDHAHLADLAFPSAHASTHNAGGSDVLAPATATASGMVPTPPNDGNLHLSGLATFTQVIPAGVIMPFGGAAAPVGFLLCDGTSYPVASFPNLFATLGYTYGGSGPNFSVPDMRGRVPVGAGQGTGLTNRALGGRAGEENHTLSIAEMAAHTHVQPDHFHTFADIGYGNHSHSASVGDHQHGIPGSGNHNHGDPGHTHAVSTGVVGMNNPVKGLGGGGFTYFTPEGIGIAAATCNLQNSGNIGPLYTYWSSQTNNGAGNGNSSGIPPVTVNACGNILSRSDYESKSMGAVGILSTTGSGAAHNNMQPSLFLNYIVKV
jgi:microcystin-dependent protein